MTLMYQQTSFMDTPGAVRHDHPETSREAARKVAPRTMTQKERVLESLRLAPQTDEELQVALRMSPNTQRPRRVELVKELRVVDSGKRRKTIYGCDSIVWRVA